MSSFAGYCGVCGKPVMHKTLFGTLHLCLSTEEKVYQAMQSQQQSLPNIDWLRKLRGFGADKPYKPATSTNKGENI